MKLTRRRVAIALAIPLAALAFICAAVAIRTAMFRSVQPKAAPVAAPPIAAADVAARLSRAIQFPTISSQDRSKVDFAQFEGFRAHLAASFPRVFAMAELDHLATHSLLLKWPGADPALKPILFMAHQDVVPVEPGTESQWTHPAFSGDIADGFIWGRGTIDDKGPLMGILEAAELLAGEGFKPARTIYFAFGHDEEVGGTGAEATVALLKSRGVELDWVLDEGLLITEGMVPGLDPPAALIGLAEKGYMTLELLAEAKGGHSSMPPRETATVILARAIARLNDRPLPGGVSGPARELFAHLGPEMSPMMRMIFANLWLFGPLVERQLAASPGTNALMRTTTAVTILEAGVKENVLPSKARALVNFRLRPGDTVNGVTAHVRAAVADERVKVSLAGEHAQEASPVSPVPSAQYDTLVRSIREVFPEAVAAPSIVVGGTDSRHYSPLTKNIFRFAPLRAKPEDLARFHGLNERIAVEDYVRMIAFYRQLMVNGAK